MEHPAGRRAERPRRDRLERRPGAFLQHYFDDRGVARVYETDLVDGVWTMERTRPDLMPLDFAQRFTGVFTTDGDWIDATWEIRHEGEDWRKDFDLIYSRVG